MISTLGIDHVAMNVKDLEKSYQFYSEVFGFTKSPREFQKPGIEYFIDCGSSLIGLIQGKEDEGEHFFRDGGFGANHVSFRVNTRDFDEAVEELKKRNIPIKFVKKREKSWSVYFCDPDGNKLEMTAWPLEDK